MQNNLNELWEVELTLKKHASPNTPEKLADLKKKGWQKGQSGNPKGKPPMPQEVKDKMAKYSPEAIEVIYDLMLNSENDMVRLKAAEVFKNVMVSNAAQKVDVEVKHNMVSEFLAGVDRYRTQLAAPNVGIPAEFTEIEQETTA